MNNIPVKILQSLSNLDTVPICWAEADWVEKKKEKNKAEKKRNYPPNKPEIINPGQYPVL